MCGIAGYFGTRKIGKEALAQCLEQMRRRGPDAQGTFEHHHPSGRNLYFLHTRLKILDLDDRSNQPFLYANHALAFNGEIYNYLELKNEVSKTAPLETQSDTEILMRLLVERGVKALDLLEGMWAFAFYDKINGTLKLSRDRFGEKPLYIFQDSTGIYFGSEVKVIQALLGRKLEINPNHLYRYLVNGYKSLNKTKEQFFRGVDQVPSATLFTVSSDGSTKLERYWKPEVNTKETMSYLEAVQGTKERLIESVRLRLRSDVPLAFCMSGGVDSNALIAIAKKILKYDVHGFTITDEDARYDERDVVQAVVKELQVRHTEIPTNVHDFIPKLRELIRYHDAPIATITYYAHWLLMDAVARNGYKISLSGTGADEIFTGYYDHHLAYFKEIQEDRELLKQSLANWKAKIKPVIQNPLLRNENIFIENPDFREHIFLESKEFASYLKTDWEESFVEENYSPNLLRNRMLNEMFSEIIPVILHEDDLNAMFFSIENRSPFLDRKLYEFSLTIPTKHLIRNGYAKAVLRDAMEEIVPAAVIKKHQKVGFNAPIYSFLDLKDKNVKDFLLGTSSVFDHVRKEKVEALFRREETPPNSVSKFIFNFVNLKIFLEEFS